MIKEEIELYKKILLQVPKDGKPKGNKTLIQQLKKKLGSKITDDDYWIIRNSLIEDGKIGKGRGKGGAIFLSAEETIKTTNGKKTKRVKESSLYQPFLETINDFWVKDSDIKNYIIQITANQGRRKTGGKWTRPDVTLVAVKKYAYLPGKIIDVITYEIKPTDDYGIASVFETTSQSVFAHKSFLSIHIPDGRPDSEEFSKIEKQCDTFGIGLIVFEDPSNWETYETIIEPKRKEPDPSEINLFIKQQINSSNQNELLEMLK